MWPFSRKPSRFPPDLRHELLSGSSQVFEENVSAHYSHELGHRETSAPTRGSIAVTKAHRLVVMAYGHKRWDLSLNNPDHLRQFNVRIWESDNQVMLHSENDTSGITDIRLKVTDVPNVLEVIRTGMRLATEVNVEQAEARQAASTTADQFQPLEQSIHHPLPSYSPHTASSTADTNGGDIMIQYLTSYSEPVKNQPARPLQAFQLQKGENALVYYNILPLRADMSYDEMRRYLAEHVYETHKRARRETLWGFANLVDFQNPEKTEAHTVLVRDNNWPAIRAILRGAKGPGKNHWQLMFYYCFDSDMSEGSDTRHAFWVVEKT